MAERPRRSARVPTKYQDKPVSGVSSNSIALSFNPRKRKVPAQKASHDDPNSLDFLLQNPKSPLVSLELSSLINEHTWSALSQDSQALLSTMLPPTVFPLIRPSLHSLHPARRHQAVEENPLDRVDFDYITIASEPNLSFFTDAFFEAAARTFQDHLYSGWLTATHETLIREYKERMDSGQNHAPWKDDTWNAEHPARDRNISASDALAGDASSLTLHDLAKHSVLHIGDILAYRRVFSQLNITVTKDALIRYIHPTTRSLTVLVAPSMHTYLPPSYLAHPDVVDDVDDKLAPGLESRLQEMTITNPTQLEGSLLDIDARVEKARRPNGNAWKCLGVWRWSDGAIPVPPDSGSFDEAARGGREYRGTLFYLRGCFYDDQ